MNTEPNAVSVDVTVSPTIDRFAALRVMVVLTNQSQATIQLNRMLLQSPTTTLKVKGPDQIFVKPGPPPVPQKDDGQIGRIKLGPNQSMTLQYSGYGYAAGRSFAPGTYQVMFRYENKNEYHGDWVGIIESAWVDVQVQSV